VRREGAVAEAGSDIIIIAPDPCGGLMTAPQSVAACETGGSVCPIAPLTRPPTDRPVLENTAVDCCREPAFLGQFHCRPDRVWNHWGGDQPDLHPVMVVRVDSFGRFSRNGSSEELPGDRVTWRWTLLGSSRSSGTTKTGDCGLRTRCQERRGFESVIGLSDRYRHADDYRVRIPRCAACMANGSTSPSSKLRN
jgi:hypothetical protein